MSSFVMFLKPIDFSLLLTRKSLIIFEGDSRPSLILPRLITSFLRTIHFLYVVYIYARKFVSKVAECTIDESRKFQHLDNQEISSRHYGS